MKYHYDKIINSKNEMSGLSYAMYEVVNDYLQRILKKVPNRIIVIGGI